jgi:hypothetical protein
MGAGASIEEAAISDPAVRKDSTPNLSWTKFDSLPERATANQLSEVIGVSDNDAMLWQWQQIVLLKEYIPLPSLTNSFNISTNNNRKNPVSG